MINDHLISWVESLHLPSLGAIGLAKEEKVSTLHQHPAKFGGHMSSEERKIWFLVSNVTLFDQVCRGICDFLGSFTSL